MHLGKLIFASVLFSFTITAVPTPLEESLETRALKVSGAKTPAHKVGTAPKAAAPVKAPAKAPPKAPAKAPAKAPVKAPPTKAPAKTPAKAPPTKAIPAAKSPPAKAASGSSTSSGKKSASSAGTSKTNGNIDANTERGGKNKNPTGPSGQMDCSLEGKATCATMCYAALCLPSTRGTGIALQNPLTGKVQLQTTPLSASLVSAATNRKAAGCRKQQEATKFKKAGLISVGGQCDEWPPASAKSGGNGAVIQIVPSQFSQAAAVKQAVNGNGLILMRNFASVPECKDLAASNKAACGKSKKFGIFQANQGQAGGVFKQATF